MPTITQVPRRRLRLPPAADLPSRSLAAVLLAGAAYGLAELLAGLLIGRFFTGLRAEALLFFVFRPWLLLAAALLAGRRPVGSRIALYAAALLLASVSQSLFLAALGASNPVPEAARGLLAGGLVLLAFDLLVQLGHRLMGRLGICLAAAIAVLLLLLPGAMYPYENIVMGRKGAPEVRGKPDLMLLTALPLVWGEGGPLDANSKPAAAYKALEQEFVVRPLDLLDRAQLDRGRLVLLAQPRALAPAELVALDSWVRGGGRALILTDPALFWPSDLPLGDIRRAPEIGLLAPILDHWGLRMDPPEAPAAVAQSHGADDRRLVMFAPGRISSASRNCAVDPSGVTADCRLGKGRAIVLADADLLHDRLWVGFAGAGRERHTRISDNPLIVADLLDSLIGRPRPRTAGKVEWLDAGSNRPVAILLGMLPLLLAATPAVVRTLRRRATHESRPPDLSTGLSAQNKR